MNLKCRINEKEYDVVVQGTTFSDEYNETLDSGSVILDHIEEIKNLKPYDDVYIYENYEGEFPRSDTERRYYASLNIDRNNTAKKINVFSNVFYVSENGDNDALSLIDSIISLGGSQNLSFYTKINFYKNNLKIGELYITFPNCLFNIKNNIWNLKNTTSPIFTINQELFSIDELVNLINEIPGLNLSKLDINFSYLKERKQMFWEPVSGDENKILEADNEGFYYLFEDTKIESNNDTFGNLFSDGLIQSQANLTGIKQKNDICISINKEFDITKFKSFENSYISDDFYFAVNVSKKNNLGESKKRKKTFKCHFKIGNNNIVTFHGVVIDKDEMTNEKETFGNHIFVGNSINKVVKIVDDKYIIFEEYDLSMNLDDEFTYSFEFDEIGFIFDNKAKTKKFYKHLLLDTYYKERINVSPYLDNGKTLYKYRLQLFSEAKRLETIQLPNISITQPVKFGNKKTKTVYYYIKQFVNMYSPKIKVDVGVGKWQYLNKYYLDPKLKEIFGNVYSPSFSLNNPNLRDVLKNLMLVKDQIPIVIDDMISCLDVTKRNGTFEEKGILSVVSSLNSENYCDSLKRTYNNALSQENTCKSIEFLNFRNSDQTLMTLDNMRLETRFPIYKINKIYMCYFKKNTIKNVDENGILEDGGEEKIFLCQQDITPLVKLNSERQLLKKDWNEFENNYIPLSIEDISQYRVATIGYDIGSKYITGWGEKYNYIRNNLTWFRYNKTYIQNILSFVDAVNPYGDKEYYMLSADETNKIVIPGQVLVDVSSEMNNFFENIFGDVLSSDDNDFINPFSNMSLGLKSLFFKIEYEGFYNGTIIHSKNNGYSDITINDNSSASLTLLEKDGLFQKEKINRFSNEQVTIQARYTDINDVQSLGSVYNDDIIIYHREISVFDNVILATYYGTKDYVLKNYFTTVFAKHRPYNLLPYEESVIRAENKKVFLNFSKNKLFYEKNKTLNFKIENILNFFKANTNENAKYSNELLLKNEQINAGYMKINGEKYASDVNTFVSGNSLCLNMAMYDNVSGGIYIKEKEPDVSLMFDDVKKDFTGSVQDWYITVDDVETGSLKNIGFYFSHNENNFSNQSFEKSFIIDTFYKQIFELPKITTQQNQETNLINGEFEINKDNKELIDMTFQFEPISITNDVFFSQWMMKLNNLVGVYNKIDAEKIEIKDKIKGSIKIQYLTTTVYYTEDVTAASAIKTRTFPFVMLKINKDVFEKVKDNQNLELRLFFEDKPNTTGADGSVVIEDDVIFKYNIRYKQIKKIATDYITVDSTENIKYSMNYGGEVFETQNNKNINFKKTKYFCGMDLEEVFGENSYYFVNMDFQIKKFSSSQGNWDYAVLSDDELLQQNLIKIDGRNSNFLAYSDKEINAKTLIDSGSQAWEEIDKNGTTKLKYTSSSINISEYNVNDSVTDEYPKNMFIVLSNQPMKEHLVYDEYEDISEVSGYVRTDYKVGDIVSLNGKSGPHINVNLNGINETDYQSVQMWYYVDGSYKFVFGVNVTEDDKDNGEIKIYVSTISNKDPRVFDSNGLLVGEVVNYLDETNDKTYGKEQYFKKK